MSRTKGTTSRVAPSGVVPAAASRGPTASRDMAAKLDARRVRCATGHRMGCHPTTPWSELPPPKGASSARGVQRPVIVAMNAAEVIIVLNERPAVLLAAAADLDECDGYVVLVLDPETGE